jgi:endonuclease/exonuclease/phosphatase family metal-dependent hydrolase
MKLIQINTWMGSLTRKIVEFIEREQPDIICAQEVLSLASGKDIPIPYKQFNCLEEMKVAGGGFDYLYLSPQYTVDIAGEVAEFGNAILSRYPIKNSETLFTIGSLKEHITADNYTPNGSTNAQVVVLNVDGRELAVVNHHGYWAIDPYGSDDNVKSMKKVAELAGKYAEYPLILAGDLNVVPESDTMRVFDGWLEDLVATSDAKTTMSPLKVFQKVYIEGGVLADHILVNDKILVNSFAVGQELISDHLPLVLEFDIK